MLNSVSRIHEPGKQDVEIRRALLDIISKLIREIYNCYSCSISLCGSEYTGFPVVNYTTHIVKVLLSLKLQLHPGHFRVLAQMEQQPQKEHTNKSNWWIFPKMQSLCYIMGIYSVLVCSTGAYISTLCWILAVYEHGQQPQTVLATVTSGSDHPRDDGLGHLTRPA